MERYGERFSCCPCFAVFGAVLVNVRPEAQRQTVGGLDGTRTELKLKTRGESQDWISGIEFVGRKRTVEVVLVDGKNKPVGGNEWHPRALIGERAFAVEN